jgi:hypothetical protein
MRCAYPPSAVHIISERLLCVDTCPYDLMTLSEEWGLPVWKQAGDEGKPTGIDLNPGSTTGMDDSVVDEENWTCFVNSVHDKGD